MFGLRPRGFDAPVNTTSLVQVPENHLNLGRS